MKREPLAVLREVFGHSEFRGPQEKVIGHVVAGGDALVLAPTGIGKSATFQVASLCREGTGVVVSPLIALMADQVQHLHAAGVRAAFLNSTQTQDQQRKVRDDLAAGRLDFIYVTPERLVMPGFQAVLSRTKISLFAVDEAHCRSRKGAILETRSTPLRSPDRLRGVDLCGERFDAGLPAPNAEKSWADVHKDLCRAA